MGSGERFVPVTDPSSDAPDGAVIRYPDGGVFERIGDEWMRLDACTGVTARWCPLHGDCSCPQIGSDPGDRAHDADGCPLHDSLSLHAEAAGDLDG